MLKVFLHFWKNVNHVSLASNKQRLEEEIMNVKNIVALVTGAASGLGEATARHLLELGARGIVLIDTNVERGQALQKELGERALFISTDITEEYSVQKAVEIAVERFGTLHAVIGAAGIAGPAKLIGRNGPIAMSKFDAVVKVNLYGTVHILRAVAPVMQLNDPNDDGERGVFIHVASGAAFEGQIGQMAYSASKAALVGMTMPLARELGESGIRVVTIAPGSFDTPIYEQMPAAVKQNIINLQLSPKRLGKPREFALFTEEVIRNPVHNGRTYRFDGGAILPASL